MVQCELCGTGYHASTVVAAARNTVIIVQLSTPPLSAVVMLQYALVT
jgi:hypothetical protein